MKRMWMLISVLTWALPAWADPNVLFVLDGSGSMWGKVGDKPKIELARESLKTMLQGMPENVRMGLVAYGHRKKGDCEDIELLAPLGSDAAVIAKAVDGINPKGKTPLTAAIRFAAEKLKGAKDPASIVVVSDGKESCDADPCAAAAEVRKAGVKLTIDVVGFDVKQDEAEQLQCIAKNGGGRYYAANDAAALTKSLAEIKKKVVKLKAIFRDDFDGAEIGEQWEVVNPDPDNAIVEEGMLQIITQVPEGKLFNAKNLLLYKGELPKEYEVEARVLMTQMEKWYWSKSPFVGLILKQDDDNAIILVAGVSDNCRHCDAVEFRRVKDGKWEAGFEADIGKGQKDRPVRLKLRRMQRKFIGSYSADGGKTWKELGSFTILRPHFRLGLIAARGSNDTHAMLDKVDWIELRDLKR